MKDAAVAPWTRSAAPPCPLQSSLARTAILRMPLFL